MTMLCKKASASKDFTLSFFSAMMKAMEDTMSEKKVSTFVALWKIAASSLGDHIDKHQEVDQRPSGQVEHDLSGVMAVLELPLKYLRAETGRQLWKQWVDLLKQGRDSISTCMSLPPVLGPYFTRYMYQFYKVLTNWFESRPRCPARLRSSSLILHPS